MKEKYPKIEQRISLSSSNIEVTTYTWENGSQSASFDYIKPLDTQQIKTSPSNHGDK